MSAAPTECAAFRRLARTVCESVRVDWTTATPFVTSILALMGSGFAILDARRARRETARIDLTRSVVTSLNTALELFDSRDKDDSGGIATVLVRRRGAAESALDHWGHLLPVETRNELRNEKNLLGESQAYLAGRQVGLSWKGSTDHLVSMEEFPTRVADFANRVEKSFSAERDYVSESLRTFY